MTPSGREHLDTIHRDIGCPKCNYNLRGLSGETVACPECGERWHVNRISIVICSNLESCSPQSKMPSVVDHAYWAEDQ